MAQQVPRLVVPMRSIFGLNLADGHLAEKQAKYLYRREGYEVVNATMADQLRGLDFRVRLHPGPWLTVDVKWDREAWNTRRAFFELVKNTNGGAPGWVYDSDDDPKSNKLDSRHHRWLYKLPCGWWLFEASKALKSLDGVFRRTPSSCLGGRLGLAIGKRNPGYCSIGLCVPFSEMPTLGGEQIWQSIGVRG